MPATYTPIRYPGGKTKLYPLVREIIDANGLRGCTYCEPFAGGAGLAMKLLLRGDVAKVAINDADRAVCCMWRAIVEDPDGLCAFISDVELSVDEWRRQRDVYQSGCADAASLARAAFYLNRTNVSGILKGGIIGGLGQRGRYKMDARFNRGGLVRKVRAIAERAGDISVSGVDAEDFIDCRLPDDGEPLVYLDPPYVKKGPGLYKNSFDEGKHRSLAARVLSCDANWMATYDDDPLVSELYGGRIVGDIRVGYSAHHASSGTERLILSPGLAYGYETAARVGEPESAGAFVASA